MLRPILDSSLVVARHASCHRAATAVPEVVEAATRHWQMSGLRLFAPRLVPSAATAAGAGLVGGGLVRVARCEEEQEEGVYLDPALEHDFDDLTREAENENLRFAGEEGDYDDHDSEGQERSQSTVGVADVFNVDVSGVAAGLMKHQKTTENADFIFAAETGQKTQRPWGEKMTFYTGCGLLGGGFVGAMYGTWDGYTNAKGTSRKIVVNSVINQAGLIGTRVSNKFGVMALMYSTIGMMCSYVRDEDDQLTSIGVSALTGAVLSSGPPQSRALTIAGVTASMSAINFLDSWQRENSARTYARRGRLQRAMG
jgi:hypothetical protein